MAKLRQRLASLVTAGIFLGFLWLLFDKVIVVVWIRLQWWHLLLLLGILFLVIDNVVSRSFGTPSQIDKKKDDLGAAKTQAVDTAQETLDDIKRRLGKTDPTG